MGCPTNSDTIAKTKKEQLRKDLKKNVNKNKKKRCTRTPSIKFSLLDKVKDFILLLNFLGEKNALQQEFGTVYLIYTIINSLTCQDYRRLMTNALLHYHICCLSSKADKNHYDDHHVCGLKKVRKKGKKILFLHHWATLKHEILR